MRKCFWMFGVFMLCFGAPVWAGLSVLPEQLPLVASVDYFEEREQRVAIESILQKTSILHWQRNQHVNINFGYTNNSYWLRTALENPTDQPLERLLVIDYPPLDNLHIYLTQAGKVVTRYHVGDRLPFHARVMHDRMFVLPLHFDAHSDYELYVHAASTSSLQIPMTLWESHAFSEINNFHMLGFGLFFGALLIIAAYNFFLWFSVRDSSYIFYVIYVLFFIGLLASVEGFGYQYLWPQQVAWNDRSAVYCGLISLIFATLFTRNFLHLPKLNPTLNKIGWLYIGILTLVVSVSSFTPYHFSVVALFALSIFWSVFAMVVGVINYRAGNRSARYFIFAWIFLAVGNVIYALGIMAVIPRNFWVGIALPLGELIEVLLLSFALADRINRLRIEKTQALRYAGEIDKKSAEVLKDANQKLQKALDMAEENHRKKDRFIMTVSHELRTPLNAISASVGQLNDVSTDDEKQSLQKFIKFGADRLSAQVENLIMLAETDQSEIKPHIRIFYIEPVLRHVTRVAEAYLFNKPVKFSTEKQGENFIAYQGDDYLLVRLLMPLLENACKYTEQGEVIFHVHLHQDEIEFCISDTGPGIPHDFQAFIYESFTQVSEGYQRSHEGLGIGLTACKRIAGILDARIRLESEIGKGSRFSLRVPLHAEIDAKPFNQGKLEGDALIVEDNLVNAKVLTALVKKLGMAVELAENGLIALEKIRRHTFDVVLMDLQMPVMDGFHSALNMRKEGVHCPIIAVTANSDYEARMRCLEVGMNDLIAKPLNKETLKEKLSLWIYQE